MKKTRVKKSRDTVPLRNHQDRMHTEQLQYGSKHIFLGIPYWRSSVDTQRNIKQINLWIDSELYKYV